MDPQLEFWVLVGLRSFAILAAIAAGLIAWMTYRQNRRSNRRSAWFERIRWALELTTSTVDAEVALGWSVLPKLMEKATKDDADIAEAVRDFLLASMENGGELPGTEASTSPDAETRLEKRYEAEVGEDDDTGSSRT